MRLAIRGQTPQSNSAAQLRCPTPLPNSAASPTASTERHPSRRAGRVSKLDIGDGRPPKPATCHADQLGAATPSRTRVSNCSAWRTPFLLAQSRLKPPGRHIRATMALALLLRSPRYCGNFAGRIGSRCKEDRDCASGPHGGVASERRCRPRPKVHHRFAIHKLSRGITARTPTRMASLRQDPIGELPFCWRSPRSRSSFPSCSCPHLARAGAAGSTNRRLQ